MRAAPDAILGVDRTGAITMANPAAATMFGHSEAELIGRSVDTLIPDEEQLAHRAHRTRFHAAPQVRPMADPKSRVMAKHASGRLIPVEVSLSPVEIDGEERVMAVIRDVSARLAAEAEQEIIRQSLDAIDDGVFLFAPETLEFSYVNVGAERQTGYSRQELTSGMTPLHIKPLLDRQSFSTLLEPLLDGSSQAITFETIHRRKDGTDLPVEISLTHPVVLNGSMRPLVALVRDVSGRKKAEADLQRSEEAFRSAFEDAPVPMAMADLSDPDERPIVAVNTAFESLLGRPAVELIGETVAAITHPEDLDRDVARATRLVDEGGSYGVEKRYLRADGSYVWGELHASLSMNREGRPTTIAHIVDISRRVEAEAERDRREGLLAILADIREEVLREHDLDSILEMVAESTGIWTAASHAVLLMPTVGDELECRAVHGSLPENRLGRLLPPNELMREVLTSGQAVVLTEPADAEADRAPLAELLGPTGPMLLLPLVAPNSIEGILIAARGIDAPPFDERDRATASALASEAALTIVLERGRRDRHRMSLVQDRERIARDLHDLVIQRLFATGMNLQSSLNSPDHLRKRAAEAITGLDETISVIRRSIFELTQEDESLSGEVERLIDRHRAVGRNAVELEIEGDLELLGRRVRDQLIPVLNELLTNVERHADASTAWARLEVDGEQLVLTVSDDGSGMSEHGTTGFGTTNVRNRATNVGGEVTWDEPETGSGTRVVWTAPLNPPS